MKAKSDSPFAGFLAEVRVILAYARKVWHLVPGRRKAELGLAAGLMGVISACNVAFPLLLGGMVDAVKSGSETGQHAGAMLRTASGFLLLIALAYLLREGLQVLRRFLVENACTRIEKVMTAQVISRLIKIDLSYLTSEKIGALQGRISRSVVGFVRFLRLGFLDFFPPLLTGLFAIAAVLSKQPLVALAMAGVVPLSLLLTVRQLLSQKGIRLHLIHSREVMDGTVVELLGGIDYIRAADTQEYEVRRVWAAAERTRALEQRHHFRMSLFGCAKALNEGLFHILVLAMAIYLAIVGTISFGDVLTFSILFLSVMAPLNEVHRGLDEGHECSLHVSNLLELLHHPVDDSFSPEVTRRPRVESGKPLFSTKDLVVEYQAPTGVKRALDGVTATI
jgi:ATP-binding cassette subfamily B protein